MQRARGRAQLCVLLWSNPPRALACDLRIFAEMGVYACARARPWSVSGISISALRVLPHELRLSDFQHRQSDVG